MRHGGKFTKSPRHLAAVDLTAQFDFAVAIHPVQLKNVLCQIYPNRCNIHGGRSHPQLSGYSHLHFGTTMPIRRMGASIPLLWSGDVSVVVAHSRCS